MNSNSSYISNRVNIALFVSRLVKKKISEEDGKNMQDCSGQFLTCKWMELDLQIYCSWSEKGKMEMENAVSS